MDQPTQGFDSQQNSSDSSLTSAIKKPKRKIYIIGIVVLIGIVTGLLLILLVNNGLFFKGVGVVNKSQGEAGKKEISGAGLKLIVGPASQKVKTGETATVSATFENQNDDEVEVTVAFTLYSPVEGPPNIQLSQSDYQINLAANESKKVDLTLQTSKETPKLPEGGKAYTVKVEASNASGILSSERVLFYVE